MCATRSETAGLYAYGASTLVIGVERCGHFLLLHSRPNASIDGQQAYEGIEQIDVIVSRYTASVPDGLVYFFFFFSSYPFN
jgi:hypothetical protein